MLAYTVAACSPNLDVATVALPAYVVTQLFFMGFLIRQPNMPAYWRFWAPYLDFMRYAFFALMTNEFEGRPDVLLDGVPVLEFYDITDSKWAYLGYESLFFAGFFCLAFLVREYPIQTWCASPVLSLGCMLPALATLCCQRMTAACVVWQALTFCKHSRR